MVGSRRETFLLGVHPPPRAMRGEERECGNKRGMYGVSDNLGSWCAEVASARFRLSFGSGQMNLAA